MAGPTLGGNTVTISGTGFAGATAVGFGSAGDGTNLVVVSDSEIIVTAPGSAAITDGTVVDVTVTTPMGTSAVSAADQYTYKLWAITGTVRGRWVTGLDEDENPELNGDSGGSLAGAFVYLTVNALDPLYDEENEENNTVTFWDGTAWVDHAVTATDGTYTFSTASFRGEPLPIGTIIDVSAVHDLTTFGAGAYDPDLGLLAHQLQRDPVRHLRSAERARELP